ncbi:hypothetical protein DET49_1191 [Salegentibacter sp. 24]|uniref:hypothetical protein n=1 Tax=Salegentibacter sp. 24 TaxID=2183986 RepID=UPI00105E4C38|nr:hypothetical protein [Salegentibacter sp. 24]TDN84292.1 hypothetical protein DET49_1191 [Salegentibacter sp. 24]
MKRFLFILICGLLITSCSKNNESIEPEILQADKIIFGGVYGMCGGDCRDLYLIDDQKLYKDADNLSDEYGNWSNTSFEEELDQNQFTNTESLLRVPSTLLNQDTSDELLVQSWADVDYYIYIEKDGKTKELILDHIHPEASPEVKAYFNTFLKSYKELGGYMIDTINIERYY